MKKSRLAALVLAAAFAAVSIFAAWHLISLYRQDCEQQEKFDLLAEKYAPSSLPPAPGDLSSASQSRADDAPLPSRPTEDAPLPSQPTEDAVSSQPPSVFDQYPDMAAWIRIEGTKVDYPVMQTPENPNYYLRRDLDGKPSSYGVPYLQENCDLGDGDNLIVYGHAFKNGAMFGSLKDYEEKSFWKDHRTIQLMTPAGTRVYTVFAVFKVDLDDENCFAYWNFTAGDAAAYRAFVRQADALSFYDTGVVPEDGRQLLTLSTCEYTYANGRLVVAAVRTE